ncbi:unnamed protein product [Orchesella dallaii]|uniref:Uncharacterized protein n=1 Tax=Orchesella dallaii TaxID=48710 RepID=A0ABP1Q8Z6_9HEXA
MANYNWAEVLILAVTFVVLQKSTVAVDIGKLVCTENGLYPDDKLVGIVQQKCQPKLDDPKETLIACMTKCMMKQLKALNKKGKLKKAEASKLATLLPETHQDSAKEKFETCYKSFHSKIKKESKCDSWIPFSTCFVGWAEKACKIGSTTPAPE